MEKYFKSYAYLILFSIIALSSCKSSACIEKQSTNCVCTYEYNPVCGCNNKTYGNACEAQCNGITHYTQGACK
ncbi:MAG TPA: Kazal-type serine protease inhibitor [Bacteroidales bacterium]|nr:Kazal-type serine protease inhibitor [Bacteroidales bacterium]